MRHSGKNWRGVALLSYDRRHPQNSGETGEGENATGKLLKHIPRGSGTKNKGVEGGWQTHEKKTEGRGSANQI